MSSIAGSTSNPYAALGLADPGAATAARGANKTELGQSDFLMLLTTQLKNQDPTKPMDPTAFLGQMTQFSQIQGIQDLNKSFASLADKLSSSQVLEGAALVGRNVLVASNKLALAASGSVNAAADITQGGNATAIITNAAGAVVRTIDLGMQSAGRTRFSWDGNDAYGQRAAPGSYQLAVQVGTGAGATAADTLVSGRVSGVQVAASGLQVDVAGAGLLPLSSIQQIQ